MFAKLSTLALLLPLVVADITIVSINPSSPSPGGPCTISWTASTTDPGTFSIELVNVAFNNEYAIANNVPTANGQITVNMPQIPTGGGYSIQFIAPNNVNDVYAQSGGLTVSPSSSSSGTLASSTPLTTASSGTSSASFSTPSFTTPASSGSSVASQSTPGTSSAASSTPSTLNNSGAASFKLVGVAPATALVLSAIAGAVMVF